MNQSSPLSFGRLLRWSASLLFFFFVIGAVGALEIPSYSGPVSDQAGVLSSEEIDRVTQKIVNYRQASSNEIGVLIVKSLEGRPIEDYSYDVFKKWGVGRAEKDNGVLFVVSVDDRKARVEVGYGLEGTLTDLEAGRLVNRNSPMADHFRKGDYAGGVEAVIGGIITAIGGDYNPPGSDDSDARGQKNFPVAAALLIGFAILSVIARLRRRTMFMGGGGFGGWGTGAMMGGFGGGGRSSGGGFSFGGGSSGGGGASGGW